LPPGHGIAAELISGCLPFARWHPAYCVVQLKLGQIPFDGRQS
jgi:hypothetical protein